MRLRLSIAHPVKGDVNDNLFCGFDPLVSGHGYRYTLGGLIHLLLLLALIVLFIEFLERRRPS